MATAEATCRDDRAAAALVAELRTLKERVAAAVLRGAGVGEASPAEEFSPVLADAEAAVRAATLVRRVEIGSEGKSVTVRLRAVESVDDLYALVIAACPE